MSNETSREKNQSEMSVEQKLKMLYDLQTVLSQIDEISIMRGELPNEVRNLEDEIEGLNVHQDKLRDEIKSIDTNVSKWKEEKNVAQATIEKNNSHLEKVRNSREYDSLSKEIEFQSLEIELRDKRIREATEQRKMRLDEIARTEEEKNNREEDLSALDDIIRETKVQEDELREKAKEYEDKMDARLLKAFKRIRKNSRNGLGIVYVQRDACGGCFNKIPPQRQLDIRMRKKVIVCEYCGRIMIDPELAGIAPEVKAEPIKERAGRRRRISAE